MSDFRAKLSRRKEIAVVALLASATMEEAARSIGISTATLRRWLQDSSFRAEYAQARQRVMDHATAHLQQGACEAAACLREIIRDSEKPASVRVSAARAVLELGLRALELGEVERRLTELERIAERERGSRAVRSVR